MVFKHLRFAFKHRNYCSYACALLFTDAQINTMTRIMKGNAEINVLQSSQEEAAEPVNVYIAKTVVEMPSK